MLVSMVCMCSTREKFIVQHSTADKRLIFKMILGNWLTHQTCWGPPVSDMVESGWGRDSYCRSSYAPMLNGCTYVVTRMGLLIVIIHTDSSQLSSSIVETAGRPRPKALLLHGWRSSTYLGCCRRTISRPRMTYQSLCFVEKQSPIHPTVVRASPAVCVPHGQIRR
jgi:hypothetical protein